MRENEFFLIQILDDGSDELNLLWTFQLFKHITFSIKMFGFLFKSRKVCLSHNV